MNTSLLAFLLALPFLAAVAAMVGAWRKRRRSSSRRPTPARP